MKNDSQHKSEFSPYVNAYYALMLTGLPLIFTNGFYNITHTKSVYFYVVSLVLLAAFVLYALIVNKRDENLNPRSFFAKLPVCGYCLIVFGLCVLLSGILSQYKQDVWFGDNSRYQGVVTVLLYIVVCLICAVNYKKTQTFLLCAVVTVSIVSLLGMLNCFDVDLLGFYSKLSDANKASYISTIGNINFYSSYMCILFPLIFCGFACTQKSLSRIIYTTALVIVSFCMPVTGSESFVVGFVFSILVFTLFLLNDEQKLKKYLLAVGISLISAQCFMLVYKVAPVTHVKPAQLLEFVLSPYISLVIIAVTLGIAFLLHKKPASIKIVKKIYITFFCVFILGIIVLFVLADKEKLGEYNKYFTIDDSWGTYRGSIWRQCIEKFKEFSLKEKLFGVGPESIYHVIVSEGALVGKRLDNAHNEYLQYLLTTGIVGLTAYLSVIVSVSVCVIRKLRNDSFAVALFVGLCAFWIQAIFNIAQPFTTPFIYVYLSVILALLYHRKTCDNDGIIKSKK